MLGRKSRRIGWIAGSGFAVGLALGIGLLAGSFFASRNASQPEIPLVLGDLKVERGKKVNLLMVSGQTTFVRGGAGANPANSTLYVCDANTGAFVAYGMLYPRTALAAAAPAVMEIRKLDIGVARSLNLGEQ